MWPPAAAAALAALALDCIMSRPARRPADMRAVIARLLEVRAALAAAPPLVYCVLCFEDVPAPSGVRCKAFPAHFVCRGCLQGTVNMNLEPRRLARNRGAIPCPFVGCASAPWPLERAAQSSLGTAYESGRGNLEIDLDKARRLYLKSAASVCSEAVDDLRRLGFSPSGALVCRTCFALPLLGSEL